MLRNALIGVVAGTRADRAGIDSLMTQNNDESVQNRQSGAGTLDVYESLAP